MMMISFCVRIKFLNLARWGYYLTVDLEPREAIAKRELTDLTFQKKLSTVISKSNMRLVELINS